MTASASTCDNSYIAPNKQNINITLIIFYPFLFKNFIIIDNLLKPATPRSNIDFTNLKNVVSSTTSFIF